MATYAQIDSLAMQKEELKKAEATLKAQQNEIARIKAEIQRLTPPKYWSKGGFIDLNFNSLGLTNWAQGGVQSNSVTAQSNAYAKFKKKKVSWDNNLDMAYGLIKNVDEDFRKNEDRIELRSILGITHSKKMNYAAMLNFKSQFAPGFDFSNPDENRQPISQFLSPAVIQSSVGFDYKPNKALSILFSPATIKMTIVNDDSIASRTTYIPNTLNAQGERLYDPNFRSEFGASILILYTQSIDDWITINSRLGLLNNYTDVNVDNRKNIDVDWEVLMKFKITEYIRFSINTHLLYDNDINIPIYNEAGDITAEGPRIQFKRLVGVGFSYSFKS